MIQIDGSFGEGGGQILRSSLALSIVTGTPFRIDNIRAGRERPGLMRQHLTAVQAAARICSATVEGDAIGSTQISFLPGKVRGGDYELSIGTAGSTTLVLQTILLPLLLASEPSRVTLEGGTHNPAAPPFDFLARSYLPLVARMGPRISATLERPGFYPAGGGRIVVDIKPVSQLTAYDLIERGELVSRRACAMVSNLSLKIADRELDVVRNTLNWEAEELSALAVKGSPGPGNVITLELAFKNVTEVFTAFGQVDRAAEKVARIAIDQCRKYLKSTAPVGEHLTDQLLLPMAIAGGGSFCSVGLSRHAVTHIELISRFLGPETVHTESVASGVIVRFGG